MENQTQRSESIESNISEHSRVPSIHLEEFLLEEHVKGLAKNQMPKIFTVAQTLKDPFILSHIKADYGSLGQFMVDVSLRKDFLTQKKKKNEVVEEQFGEKKIRQHFKQKSIEELYQIYTNPQNNNMQKKVVSKLIVQNIFKQTFNVPINVFETQNAKPQIPRNPKINLHNIEQIFRQKKQNDIRKSIQNANKQMINSSQLIKQIDTKSEKQNIINILSKEQKIQIFKNIRKDYLGLKHLDIQECIKKYEHFCEAILEKEKERQEEEMSGHKNKHAKKDVQIGELSFKLENKKQIGLNLKNITLTNQLVVGIFMEENFQRIKFLNIEKIRTSEQVLCFLIDFFLKAGVLLDTLSIKLISLEKMDHFIQKNKKLLCQCPIKYMILENIGLDSKQFCILALGVAVSSSLIEFNVSNNQIDMVACRSLQLISKHCKNLKKIDISHNFIKSHFIPHLPPESKKKIKL